MGNDLCETELICKRNTEKGANPVRVRTFFVYFAKCSKKTEHALLDRGDVYPLISVIAFVEVLFYRELSVGEWERETNLEEAVCLADQKLSTHPLHIPHTALETDAVAFYCGMFRFHSIF